MPNQPPPRSVGVQSVELLLDTASETLVLQLWRRLLDAGMPSQARHRGASNRPHLTLVAVPTLPEHAEPWLVEVVTGRLPVLGTWGEVAAFGRGPWTLVWLVEPSADLRRLHADVAGVCDVPAGDLTAPPGWTPHVTLARRATAEDLDTVRDLVSGPVALATGTPVAGTTVRRWDATAKVDWVVSSAAGQA